MEDKTSDIIIISVSFHLYKFCFISLDPKSTNPFGNKLGGGAPYHFTVVARDETGSKTPAALGLRPDGELAVAT